MHQERTKFDPGAECRHVAEHFREVVAPRVGRPAGAGAVEGAERKRAAVDAAHVPAPDPGITPENIIVFLPYVLADAFKFPGCLEAGRTMARANALGAAHFLQGDRLLDGDEAPVPRALRFSDAALCAFVREFASLFPPASPFWAHFDRHMSEYYESLDWERTVLWTERGAVPVGGDFTYVLGQLGRKMAPLKATAAGVSLLAGRPDTLGGLERVIEDYHSAYQLADDLQDLEGDLRAGRWSAAAWFLTLRSGAPSPSAFAGAAELLERGAATGALEELAGVIRGRYQQAASRARDLGAAMLAGYLSNHARRATVVLGPMSRRLAFAVRVREGKGGEDNGAAAALTRADAARIHSFAVGVDSMVYDTASGLFFRADAVATDVAAWLSAGASSASLSVLRMDHGGRTVDEALREFELLAGGPSDRPSRGLPERATPPLPGATAPPSLTPLASIALNVSGDCNLACDYCYLGGRFSSGARMMSDATAFRAVDLLFAESFGSRELAVVFFGGEPLLNAELIERAARYALERARSERRRVRFHLTTNGTLLTPDVASSLASLGVNVLVSIDGPAGAHDRHRAFQDGSSSYEIVASNVRALPADCRPGARVTITEDSPPLAEVVGHLAEMGFGVVHTSPVSGMPMGGTFAARLSNELEDLAREDLVRIHAGARPRAGCFIEPALSLELGLHRLAPCGAGARYVSVNWDGRLFLCHRFAGDSAFGIGDLDSGLDRHAVGELLASAGQAAARCERCWALGLCGGLCYHDAAAADSSPTRVADERCRVTRRILELSMWLYASLPEERRARLAKVARQVGRPEMCARDRANGGR